MNSFFSPPNNKSGLNEAMPSRRSLFKSPSFSKVPPKAPPAAPTPWYADSGSPPPSPPFDVSSSLQMQSFPARAILFAFDRSVLNPCCRFQLPTSLKAAVDWFCWGVWVVVCQGGVWFSCCVGVGPSLFFFVGGGGLVGEPLDNAQDRDAPPLLQYRDPAQLLSLMASPSSPD